MSADLDLIAEDPDLAPLWTVIHDRMCSGQAAETIAAVRVPTLTPSGIATLRSWLDTTARRRGVRSAVTVGASGVRVPLRELLTLLGLTAEHLPYLVERAVGRPVVDRAANRRTAAALRQELWDYASGALPHVPALVARMRAAGVADDDAASVRRIVDALAAATSQLPRSPAVSLAKLSHDCTGDPHYFDLDTTPGARLVAAIAELDKRSEPSRPDLVRALLADYGVIADRLSATVLLYRVQAVGDGPVDRRLREAATPVALTLLDLTRTPPMLAPQVLTVVENPSVLEAAMACDSPGPLACTSGQLSSVDHTLLQLAVDQGIHLRYSGDLDGSGLRIAEYVARVYGAELVAMDASTVRDAGPEPSSVTLGSTPEAREATVWNALKAGGRAIFQEHDAVLRQVLGQPAHSPTAGPGEWS
ncbi:TIGR02679 domain-containing protein [Streptomyces sp. DSM 42041]|uniref:TIGR02679 domain-containing protein n=1 Tax=Streptomyces hazeniae TaxID=3075538 RepID=A0ABU2P1P7_9ACTN|nr:TIGR02679 domain-containing protein [Streptomyces sp. DSM 42041]MDT0382127.1 TIGR02679 domain-containing protein [Streptomyces sp. DSM 42041]